MTARDRLILASIIVVAFVIRLVCTFEFAPPTTGLYDGFYFEQLGRLLAGGHGFVRPWEAIFSGQMLPTAEHPPLYPLVLGAAHMLGISGDMAQRSLGAGFGAITTAIVGVLGRRIAGDAVGVVSALLTALYPQLIAADAALLSETLYTPLIAGTLVCAHRVVEQPTTRRAIELGGLVGLATLTRSEAILLLVLLVGPVAAMARARGTTIACVACAAALLVLSPWLVRNYVVFGRPLLSNNVGSVVVQANCKSTYSGRMLGTLDAACLGPRIGSNEAEVASHWHDEGVAFARAHAHRLPVVVVARILRVWSLWHPLQGIGEFELEGRGPGLRRLGLVGYYLLLPFAIVGTVILMRAAPSLTILLAPAVLASVVAALAAGWIRFRHAAEPSLVLLAAVAVHALLSRCGWRIEGVRTEGDSPES